MHEFTLPLEAGQGKPLYEQLVDYVAGEIRAGRFLQGEKLPSRRALCAHLGISLSTVETAYEILCAEGYIESRARSGYYVRAYLAPVRTPRQSVQPPSQPQESGPRFAFSTAEVDTSAFPYASWARLYRQVVHEGPPLLLRGHPQGDAELREVLSAFLHQYRGVQCEPGQILIGAGMEYLMGLLPPLLGREALFALEDPGYPSAYRLLLDAAHPFVSVALDGDGLRVDALRACGASVAFVTPSHQFPTGITMSVGRRAQLLDWANAAPGRYVIEDDYDSEFRHLTRPIPAMQGMDSERVIYLGTFNRGIAPAVRVAYMVLPPALMERFRVRFSGLSASVSRFEQQALARFIEQGHYARHLRRMGLIYRRRRDALVGLFATFPEVALSGHEAGLHCLLTHSRLGEAELVVRAREQGVGVRGLSEYAHSHAFSKGALVLGYGGLNEADLPEIGRRLRRAWRDE